MAMAMRRSLVLAVAAAATVSALPDRGSADLGIQRQTASSSFATGVPSASARRSAAAVGVVEADARQKDVRPAVRQGAGASYGHDLFQDLFDSLDKVICKISPAKENRTEESSRGASLDRLSSPTASKGGDFPHLKSPRSVAEIRNSGGFPVVPATLSSAAGLAAATSPARTPPPYAASVMESPRRDPAAGERDIAPTASTYVRGVTEHLLRMAAAKGARVQEPRDASDARPASSLASQMLKGTSNGLQEARRLLLGEVENDDSDDTSSDEVALLFKVDERSDRLLSESRGLALRKETGQAAGKETVALVKGEEGGGDGRAQGVARDSGFVTPQKQEHRRDDVEATESDSPVTYRAAQASPWQSHSRGRKTALDETVPPRLEGDPPLWQAATVASRHGAVAVSDGPLPASACSESQDIELRERSAALGEKQDRIKSGVLAPLVQQVPSGEGVGRRWDKHEGWNSSVGAPDVGVSMVVAGLEEGAGLAQGVVKTLQVNATASVAGGGLTHERSGSQGLCAPAAAGRMPGYTLSSFSGVASWAEPRLLQALAVAAAGVGCWRALGFMMPARNYSPVRVYSGYSLLDVPLTIMDTILVDASDVI